MQRKTLYLLIAFVFIPMSKMSAQINNKSSENFSVRNFDKEINFYLKKHTKQKTTAWILLSGGYVLIAVGANVTSGKSPNGEAVLVVGGLVASASPYMFFSASKNKNKAKLISLERNIAMATSDSMRNIFIKDGFNYFNAKAKANQTPAIILSSLGGIMFIGAMTVQESDGLISPDDLRTISVIAGLSYAASAFRFMSELLNTEKPRR